MLRRTNKGLRLLLFILGAGLLLWTPLSFFVLIDLQAPLHRSSAAGEAEDPPQPVRTTTLTTFAMRSVLVIGVHTVSDPRPAAAAVQPSGPDLSVELIPAKERSFTVSTFLPRLARHTGAHGFGITYSSTNIRIPLWLLAFLLLAWPMTSLILARRRQRHGFPVEAASGAPKVRHEPEPGARYK